MLRATRLVAVSSTDPKKHKVARTMSIIIQYFFQVKSSKVSREEQRKLYRLTDALNAGGEAILYNQIYFGNNTRHKMK